MSTFQTGPDKVETKNRRRQGALRSRLIVWLFAPTVVVLIAVAFFVFHTYQRVTENLVIERDIELTSLYAQQLSTELSGYVSTLDALARNPDIWRFEPAVQQVTLRWAVTQLRPFDAGVMIVNRDGRVVAADPRRPETVGQDWSARSYVRQALDPPVLGSAVFSDITPDGPKGEEVVALTLAVRDGKGATPGMIVGMFRIHYGERSDLYRRIMGSPVRPGVTLYLVDRQGRAIYHHDETLIGQDLSAWPPVQSVVTGRAGALRTRSPSGAEIVASHAPVPDLGWGLVAEESWSTLTGRLARYERLLLALLALGLVGPALIVTMGARRVTKPLARLVSAAQDVARGRLDQRIVVHTGDELEELAEQFNAMSAELRTSYATLEQRVDDRTRELATINAISAVVSRSLDLRTVLDGALEEILGAVDMDLGLAYRLDEEQGALNLAAQRGLSTDAPATVLPEDWGAGDTLGEPLILPSDAVKGSALQAFFHREKVVQAVIVPLTSKGAMLGILLLATRQTSSPTPETLALLRGIGQQTGVAMENARLYERAEQTAVAAERGRLARELHDAVTQTLFSINLIAGVLPMLWERNPADGRRRLEELRLLTRGALAEMRTLLIELRPTALIEAPLSQLLRQLGEATAGRQRLPIDLDLAGDAILPPPVQVAFYRVAQEALNNAGKYAQAGLVSLRLRVAMQNGQATGAALVVADDGVGFDPAGVEAGHLGLGIMRERAEAAGAALAIESAPGQGTKVSIRWPSTVPGDKEEHGAEDSRADRR